MVFQQLKPKNLEETQEIMRGLLVNKKFMLVLDNIKNKSHINDVVLKDVLHSNQGSIFIVTIQNWKVVKDYSTKFYKFELIKLTKI